MWRIWALYISLLFAITIRNGDSKDALFTCSNSTAAENIADCRLASNISTAVEVKPSSVSTNDVAHAIHIWVMVPFENFYIFSKDHIESAVYQAIKDTNASLCNVKEDVANNSQKNQSTCYRILFNDTRCDADYSMTQAVAIQSYSISDEQCNDNSEDKLHGDFDVIVGMSCDYSAGRVATLATSWQWPAIFVGARTNTLDSKSQPCCQTLTRTGHTATDFANFVYKLYHEYSVWNKSYFVYSVSTNHGAPVYDATPSDCTMLTSGITSTFTKFNFLGYSPYQIPSDDYLINNTEEVLEQIRKTSRVSMWCVGRKAMRKVMNTAHKMGMTRSSENEQFVFFYVDLYNTNTSFEWNNVDDQPCSPKEYCDADVGTSTEGMRALQVITIHPAETAEYKEFSGAMKNDMNQIQPGLGGTGQYVNPYVAEYYNAIRLLVNGVESRIEENKTDWSDGAGFAQSLWNTSFLSVDGVVLIKESGDQVMNYALMDMNETTDLFEVAAVYYGFNSSWINVKQIDWPGPAVPPNKPPCGNYDACPEEIKLSTGVIALISVACVLAVLLIVSFFLTRRKLNREKRLRKMVWKVRPEDVVFGTRERRTSTSTGSSVSDMLISGAAIGRQMFAKTAQWKNHFVAVKPVAYVKKINVDRELQLEMEMVISLDHEHLCRFFGASVEAPIMILTEYCPRGSLQDFLGEDMYGKLDDVFRNSLISDIAQGMQFLHKTSIQSHGNLKSSNCLLSSRLVVKLSDFGLAQFRPRMRRDSVIGYNHFKDLLWTAPEFLRMEDPPVKGTQKGDVYSFAIVVQEILYTMGTFYLGEDEEDTRLSPNEICKRVQDNSSTPFRPTLEDNDDVVVGDRMRRLVEECWEESAENRPTFQQISMIMKKYTKKLNLFDQMLIRLEQYSSTLEEKVEERTIQYKSEKERADKLLYQMLPKGVTDKLKRGQTVEPCNFDSVTIYFSDIVGFTAISHESTPFQVVDMLDSLYTVFDQVVDRFDVYKVETIGDAYMVVSGLPELNGKLHVREISRMALSLIEEVKRFKIPHMPEKTLELRIGIHSGPVVAGVVGKKMPRYCLFGDTVNTAARMEQNGKKMRIHISPATKSLLKEFQSFILETRQDKVTMKGLGTWQTWWLKGEVRDKEAAVLTVPKIAEDTSAYAEKKISSSSDYSSARSSLQQSMQRSRRSSTGSDLVEGDETAMTPSSLVTYEMECVRSLHPQVGTKAKSKRRRTGAGMNDDSEEMAVDMLRLQDEHKRQWNSAAAEPKSAGSRRQVTFNDASSVDMKASSSASKKPRKRDSGVAVDNDAYEPSEYTTKM